MTPVTVLLSAMDLPDTSILKRLNITGRAVIINQCGEEDEFFSGDEDCLFVRTRERGLSKSRNMALRKAAALGAGICIFCDNDVLYRDDYEKVISEAFLRNPDSDILVFFIERPERHEPVMKKEAPLDRIHAMKIFSPEIAFRLSSVRRAGLRMDELFGAGAKYGMGEENIFLFDALRAGLKITYVPERIAGTIENESTWFKGYTEEFFINRGAGYKRMEAALFLPLCLQFALRKRELYRDSISTRKAFSAMLRGGRKYDREFKAFLIGDYTSGTGPANATRSLLRAMPHNTLYLKSRGKAMRALEIFMKLKKADAVVFSGHSRQNILGMKLARKYGCPSVYIMHGAVEYENGINRVPDEKMASDEREMMKLADRILAVSRRFEEWLKVNYPEYEGKIGHLTNGVDWDRINTGVPASGHENYVNRKLRLLSVGGGMPRKRINKICEAVALLREKDSLDATLYVAGAEGADSAEIDSYGFVRDMGILKKEDMLRLYRESRIFIQNSVFETFGLAPLEALLGGCDIILSDVCGVLDIFNDLREEDVIRDPEDPEEIREKIGMILNNGNNGRLLGSVDREKTGWERRAGELCAILKKMRKKD